MAFQSGLTKRGMTNPNVLNHLTYYHNAFFAFQLSTLSFFRVILDGKSHREERFCVPCETKGKKKLNRTVTEAVAIQRRSHNKSHLTLCPFLHV